MKAFVLAAGHGERLIPMTLQIPKPCIPVMNVPLIAFSLNLLHSIGVQEVIINLHHLPQFIQRCLGDGARFGLKITYSFEPEILGTAGGLKRWESFFRETFILINSDIIVDVDLTSLIEFHKEKGSIATMLLSRKKEEGEEGFGVIGVEPNGRIVRFLHIVRTEDGVSQLIEANFTGIHVLEPEVFKYIPDIFPSCINRDVYPEMILHGEEVFGFLHDGYWSDLGTPKRYLRTHWDLLDGVFHHDFGLKRDAEGIWVGKDVSVDPSCQVIPPVVIGSRSLIEACSKIGGYSVIGDRVTVRRDSVIERSVVLDGSTVERGTRLRNTIFGQGFLLRVEGY
jgi:mannose-1-phosphate guanylyltransferase/phosphomannomutase